MLSGIDAWRTPPIPRLGIPSIKTTDGPNGARGESFMGVTPAACFPCASALAATWDVTLAAEVGRHLAAEVRSKGAHVLLAPTVNLHRHPLAGRNFECFSEDPHLTARLAVALVAAVQAEGVGTAVKHFVANDSEFERMTISSEVDERSLRELYLVPFEAALLEAGSWLVMSAYNRLNGTYCSEHPWLLTELLRDEWGWDGVVISDWWGTHSTVESANAGLDWEMPGPPLYRGDKLRAAVASGEVAESVVDGHVRRMLHLAERTGAFERPAGAEAWDDDADRRAFLRHAAAAGIVVLRNQPPESGSPALLPLDAAAVRTVAVIGPNGADTAVHGGGCSMVAAPYEVSVVDGLAARPDLTVTYEEGCRPHRPISRPNRWRLTAADGSNGVDVVYFAGQDPGGAPVRTEKLLRPVLGWPAGFTPAEGGRSGDPWSARMTTAYTADRSGPHGVRVAAGAGGFRLSVDGAVVIDEWDGGPGRSAATAEIDLTEGVAHDFAVEYRHPGTDGPLSGLNLQIGPPRGDDLLERAVAAAAEADVAVVVVGLNIDLESEGKDRRDMNLPEGQDELVRAVAAANPRTIVVVNTGSPVAMEWADEVAAVVQLWYPGQEAGHGLADVLFGDEEASGRLPTTIPFRLEDTPAFVTYPGERGQVHYGEGLFMGYRWYDRRDIPARYPFGHGLSYTSFAWGPVRVDGDAFAADDGVTATVQVTNTGERPGSDVVQIYVTDVEASVIRPEKELRGFARIHLAPGQSGTVTIPLGRRAFAFWDRAARDWVVEPGQFEILAAASATDIRSRVAVTVTED